MFRYWFTSLVAKPTYRALKLLLAQQPNKLSTHSKPAQEVSSLAAAKLGSQTAKETYAVKETVLIQAHSGSSLSEMSEDSSPPSRSSSRSRSQSHRSHNDSDTGASRGHSMPTRSSLRLRANRASSAQRSTVHSQKQGQLSDPCIPSPADGSAKLGRQPSTGSKEELRHLSPAAHILLRAVPVLAVFAFSGLIHEMLLLCFFGTPSGEQFLFFIIHGVALLAEQAFCRGASAAVTRQADRGQAVQAPQTAEEGSKTGAWKAALSLVRILAWNAFMGATLILFMRPWFR
jgi:hypothetical protein